MAIYKCKMCGGNLDIEEGVSVCECEYCGTSQTIPTAADENLQKVFNRANTLRMKIEFDKAEQLYEKIIQQDEKQAEAYWGMVLCKYGIEYVEDPGTFKRIPTCHRTSYESVLKDENYQNALEYADAVQRSIYEAEAKEIERLQKEILEQSRKEEPYDVFICYKEKDELGNRTQDSVISNDIYHQLTQEGYKVFYAAISLEDKLGQAYEPCIFAALNSAKVMLALGTKPEYFQAVWVKNEWSRYMKFMKNDRSKLLIPCYRDMDAYDLPEEFAHLQAQDMSKIGFINDVVRGIEKVLGKKETANTTASSGEAKESSSAIDNLLERVFMFLEDGEWESAEEYCEKVLDKEAKNALAYVGKLMVELKVKTREKLADCRESFDEKNNYQKAIRFADEKLKAELEGYVNTISTRMENERKAREEAERIAREEKERKEKEEREAKEEAKRIAKEKVEEAKRTYEEVLELHQRKLEEYEKEKELIDKKREQQYQAVCAKSEKECEQKKTELQENIRKIEEVISRYENEKSSLGMLKFARKKELSDLITAKEAEKRKLEENIIEVENQLTGEKEIIGKNVRKQYPYPEKPAQKDNNVKQLYKKYVYEMEQYVTQFEEDKVTVEKFKKEINSFKRKGARKGDIIFFGKYPQGKKYGIKEDIEWVVLEKKKNQILVISKYALDCKQYHNTRTAVTWEKCTLRTWLNSEFMDNAFDSKEKEMIPKVTVIADKNPEYNTNPGNNTNDRIFLLSIPEVNKYFASNHMRQCRPTVYAVANKAYVSNSGNCCWWLRSPGYDAATAARVGSDGSVDDYGNRVVIVNFAIRPALWINLDS